MASPLSSKTSTANRFRISPIEVGIFCVMCLLFLNSLYTLVNDPSGIQDFAERAQESKQALAQNIQQSAHSTEKSIFSKGHGPASETNGTKPIREPILSELELNCEVNFSSSTSANKIRLTGPYCGIPDAANNQSGIDLKLLTVQVTNLSTQYPATLFHDSVQSRFSTDYIPLIEGSNHIEVEHYFKNRRVHRQELKVDLKLETK